jgi:hypothetical protein
MGLKGVDGVAGQPAAAPRAIQEPATEEAGADGAAEEEGGDRTPDPLEASSGGAPEVTVHKEFAGASNEDLSPEEQAVNVVKSERDAVDDVIKGDDDDAAKLAEGRIEPPANLSERGQPT